ncbi:MAG: hypothetical protein J0M19_05640 [Sphingomonadales bacterium]|nr:hypothetical protein [Sphingomonadales bacterium]
MKPQDNMPSQSEDLPDFRDLIDFHMRWPQFRHVAVELATRKDLSDSQREIVRWLIQLANRVGQKDILDD